MADRHAQELSAFAVRFFFVVIAVFGAAGAITETLILLIGVPAILRGPSFPPAFGFSTALLLVGSISLQFALSAVHRERQKKFRRLLLVGLFAGMLFVAVQSFGLWNLSHIREAGDPQTGVTGVIFVFAALHGLHFIVAVMFLVYVTLQAFADRYDHEYYWGVTVCTFFWHFLGAVWLCILGVFAIAVG